MIHPININNKCSRSLLLPTIKIDRFGNPFNEPVHAAMGFKFIEIYLNRGSITSGKALTDKITKLRRTNDQLTLHLFMRAINVTNSAASAVLANWNNPDIRYRLDLGTLLPNQLLKNGNTKTACDFLAAQNYESALEILCNMRALKKFNNKE